MQELVENVGLRVDGLRAPVNRPHYRLEAGVVGVDAVAMQDVADVVVGVMGDYLLEKFSLGSPDFLDGDRLGVLLRSPGDLGYRRFSMSSPHLIIYSILIHPVNAQLSHRVCGRSMQYGNAIQYWSQCLIGDISTWTTRPKSKSRTSWVLSSRRSSARPYRRLRSSSTRAPRPCSSTSWLATATKSSTGSRRQRLPSSKCSTSTPARRPWSRG